MRKPIIAGNWKMHLVRAEAESLADALRKTLNDMDEVEIVIAPAFTALSAVAEIIEGSTIQLAAQNVHWETAGAYTGEISPLMLKDVGCTYVIVGHSERRQYFKEGDNVINKKVRAVISAGLRPILCIGETLKERQEGKTMAVVRRQLEGALRGVEEDAFGGTVIAYEPVWAIGTGQTATPGQAEEVHREIRRLLKAKYSEDTALATRIQYGGSVKPENIADLMAEEDIDGALVGGASLRAESFVKIVRYRDQAYG